MVFSLPFFSCYCQIRKLSTEKQDHQNSQTTKKCTHLFWLVSNLKSTNLLHFTKTKSKEKTLSDFPCIAYSERSCTISRGLGPVNVAFSAVCHRSLLCRLIAPPQNSHIEILKIVLWCLFWLVWWLVDCSENNACVSRRGD